MQLPYFATIGDAVAIPVVNATPVVSFSPVVLDVLDRPVELQLRVAAPSTGDDLPIILLAHGQGYANYYASLEGYAPLHDFWAGHGFVVIQPTFLSSPTLALANDTLGNELNWQDQAQDFKVILDHLEYIEQHVPNLQGRLDKDAIGIAAHSFGNMGTALLLGATNTDPRFNTTVSFYDERIKAGVLMASSGRGKDDLSEMGRTLMPFYDVDFSTLRTPTLVVYGDEDVSPHLTVRNATWHADPYYLGPGATDLFTVRGGKHGLGGIGGWDLLETDDEDPERLATVQRMTWAYLNSQLRQDDEAWEEATLALENLERLGSVEHKQGQ